MTSLKKILLIDDDADILNMLRGYFTELGCEILSATNGTAGIQSAITNIPDLIICDVAMPGESGLSVLQKIRANKPTQDIPIIIFSGLNDPLFQSEIVHKGAVTFFNKPGDLALLFSKVREILNTPSADTPC